MAIPKINLIKDKSDGDVIDVKESDILDIEIKGLISIRLGNMWYTIGERVFANLRNKSLSIPTIIGYEPTLVKDDVGVTCLTFVKK